MALGGIILFLQFQNSGGTTAANIIASGSDYTAEIRVRFPGPTDTVLPPKELSGSIWTLSQGSLGNTYAALWYEKASATATTGTIYLTSSAGRLQVTSAPIFNDSFYNLTVVKEHATGSVTLYVAQYEEGELTYLSSSLALFGSTGAPPDANYTRVELGSSAAQFSNTQFWGQEARLWTVPLVQDEVLAHAADFNSYGRAASYNNKDLYLHWRLDDGDVADGAGRFYANDSTLNSFLGTGSNFTANANPFTKFLEDYSYIPSIDYGWNQSKVRTYSSSSVDSLDAYRDERFVSLEFNMYDQLNEDISHLMTSYDELNNFLGLPMNRYRGEYEGLQQMRETYFKRLQGKLDVNLFVSMLDFFDSSFVSVVQRLLPARAIFKGDELVVESHMLERPKYQYQLRPVKEGFIDISGSVATTDLWGDTFR